MPLKDWPDADQAMWTGLITGDDPFEDVGTLSHLRTTSQAALVKHYGRWLEWLYQSEPETLLQPPEHRATPERLAGWIASLHHVAPPTLYTFVNGVICVLKAAALTKTGSCRGSRPKGSSVLHAKVGQIAKLGVCCQAQCCSMPRRI